MSIDYKAMAKLKISSFEVSWKLTDPYGKIFRGVGECIFEDDALRFGREIVISAKELYYAKHEVEIQNLWTKEWCFGWDSEKRRVSQPKHRVFVSIGGYDCDGYDWSHFYSYRTLKLAAEDVEDCAASADGPVEYSTMSREEWEMS